MVFRQLLGGEQMLPVEMKGQMPRSIELTIPFKEMAFLSSLTHIPESSTETFFSTTLDFSNSSYGEMVQIPSSATLGTVLLPHFRFTLSHAIGWGVVFVTLYFLLSVCGGVRVHT